MCMSNFNGKFGICLSILWWTFVALTVGPALRPDDIRDIVHGKCLHIT